MSLEPLATWQSTFADLPKVADSSWATNFANWYDARVTNLLAASGIGGTGLTFTFNKAIFQAQLLLLIPVPDALTGISGFADAWLAAMNLSLVVMAPGSYIGAPLPALTWSTVSSTIIDAPSQVAGRLKLLELVSAPPASDPLDSEFPKKFREATLLLTITTMGLDSTPSPAGPLPLNDISRSVE